MTSPITEHPFELLKRLWTATGSRDDFDELAKSGSRLLAAVQATVQAADMAASRSLLDEIWNCMADPAQVKAKGDLLTQRNIKLRAPDYSADFRQIPGQWKGTIACAGLAVAIRRLDVDEAITWMKRAVMCWEQTNSFALQIEKIDGEWNRDSVPDKTFLSLLQQGWNVLELWDLTHFLLTGHPQQAARTVEMRVLFVVQVNGQVVGEVGTLRLEWLPEGKGFVRHPGVLLLPCDRDFLAALSMIEKYRAKQSLVQGGAVRWDLTLGDFVLDQDSKVTRRNTPPMVEGGSLGGALGVGMHLLNEPHPESDLSIAITAELLDEMGTLRRIGGARQKFEVAFAQTSWPIHDILFVDGQDGIPNTKVWTPKFAEDVKTALTTFQENMKPRRDALEQNIKECGIISLPGGTMLLPDGSPDISKIGMGGELYQEVPLLQEVDPKDLPERDPHESRPGPRSGSEERHQSLDALRWEEAMARITPGPKKHKLQDVLRGQSPRFVVLGPPGCGKTTMMRRVAWKVATDRHWLSWRAGHIVPVFVRLRQWALQNIPLPEYLHHLYGGNPATLTAEAITQSIERWRTWLKTGNVLLLLDGLDEVGDINFLQDTVGRQLREYPTCPVILTCRTVSRDRLSRVGFEGKSYPVYTPAPLGRNQQDAYVRAYPFKHRQDYDALVAQVRSRPEFKTMAGTPGLLAILCFALDDPRKPQLPSTRTELYDIVVNKLLELPVEEARKIELPEGLKPLHRKRAILEDLTLELSDSPLRPTEFAAADVQTKLDRLVLEYGYTRKDADDLLIDLGMNSRLLTGNARTTGTGSAIGTAAKDYYYSHLTFQEFLIAGAIVRRIQEHGWEPELLDRIDRYCWMPQWEEPIIFLAGLLKLRWERATNETDKRHLEKGLCDLLDLLSDERRDDLFRHRLALAALCLPEIADPK